MFFGGVHSLLDGRGSSANPTRVAQRGPELPGASWAVFFFVCLSPAPNNLLRPQPGCSCLQAALAV